MGVRNAGMRLQCESKFGAIEVVLPILEMQDESCVPYSAAMQMQDESCVS